MPSKAPLPMVFKMKYEIDRGTLLRMMKAALPPTIAVAIYQTDAISNITTTVGYLTALTSIISQCLLPRGKFLKIMFYILISTCTSAALCCLGVLSAVSARQRNDDSNGSTGTYNSSACAVAAVWLLFTIWISNTLRAFQPVLLQDPMVAFSIFSGVTLTHAAEFETVEAGIDFIRRLLITFFLGFGIATAVSILIVPISSRRNASETTIQYVQALGNVLKAQKAFVRSASTTTAVHNVGNPSSQCELSPPIGNGLEGSNHSSYELKVAMSALIEVHEKLANEVNLAQTEVAWGMLEGTDLRDLFTHLKAIMLSLSGISMLPDLHREYVISRTNHKGTTYALAAWDHSLQQFGTELADCAVLMMLGLQHSLAVLDMSRGKRSSQLGPDEPVRRRFDIEMSAEALVPGIAGFGTRYEHGVKQFCTKGGAFLQPEADANAEPEAKVDLRSLRDRTSSDLCFKVLFLKECMHNALRNVLELVAFVDSKMKQHENRSRLLYPRGWIGLLNATILLPIPKVQDTTNARQPHKDPEHLAATNAWERVFESLSRVPKFLSSDQSAFGFRAAAAAFSVALLAYLRQTQSFFFEQRLIWVLIVIVLGMSPTSGASIFGYFCRIIATIMSYLMSLGVWYIVVGRTPGVIILLYVTNMIFYYFHIKYPTIFGPSVIAIVTLNVIVGYGLQVNKLGIDEAESSGQPYYPTYEFGVYKLICVIVACAISLFWTVFPSPLSSGSQARKVLGRSLFVLANSYACMHAIVYNWMSSTDEKSPRTQRALNDKKDELFAEGMQLINTLRQHCHLSNFDPPLGGTFPTKTYTTITSEIQNVLISMALMAQMTREMHKAELPEQEDRWRKSLAKRIASTNFNSHVTTSLLCHLSSAISNGLALPPYLSPPAAFWLVRELDPSGTGIMDIGNSSDASFTAFVSLEVLIASINRSLTTITSETRDLVGEISFQDCRVE